MSFLSELFSDDETVDAPEEGGATAPPAHDEAEVDRRTWSSKYALEHAADAAACCKGRAPSEVVDDAIRVGETAANEVWQLTMALAEGTPARATAYDAYQAAADGISALRAAGTEVDADNADRHYDASWSHFQRALSTLGW